LRSTKNKFKQGVPPFLHHLSIVLWQPQFQQELQPLIEYQNNVNGKSNTGKNYVLSLGKLANLWRKLVYTRGSCQG
jgi:hypothetical protein